MWFSAAITLINNYMHHHSSQNVVDSQVAAEGVHDKFYGKHVYKFCLFPKVLFHLKMPQLN